MCQGRRRARECALPGALPVVSFRAHLQDCTFLPDHVMPASLALCVGEGSVWGVRDLGFAPAIPLFIMKTKEAHVVSDPVLPMGSLEDAQSVLDSHTAGGDQTHQMPHCSKPRAHGRTG